MFISVDVNAMSARNFDIFVVSYTNHSYPNIKRYIFQHWLQKSLYYQGLENLMVRMEYYIH